MKLKPKITRLKSGKYQLDLREREFNLGRPSFDTRAEAKAEFDRIKHQKKTGVKQPAKASNTTLSVVVETWLKELGGGPGWKRKVQSAYKNHVLPNWGNWKLDQFDSEGMKEVRARFAALKAQGYSSPFLAHVKTVMRGGFEIAIRDNLLAPPHPMDAYRVKIASDKNHFADDEKPLLPDQIDKLVSKMLDRNDDEHESAWRARGMLVWTMLLTGMRPGEACGLCWDCVDFTDRIIYVHRAWRRFVGLVDDTKTGTRGKREIPMSPILHAELGAYKAHLQSLGTVAEDQPVLKPSRADAMTSDAISNNHWPVLARKAGLEKEGGGLSRVAYSLRHTAASLLHGIGMDMDGVRRVLGHTDSKMAETVYVHARREYAALRREVEAWMMQTMGSQFFGRTNENLIEALGFTLARRWSAMGIKGINCSPPRSEAPLLSSPDPLLLAPPVAEPNIEVELPPAAPKPQEQQTRERRAWAKKRRAEGWKYQRIADELRVSRGSVMNWCGESDDVQWLRKTPHARRRGIRQQALLLRKQDVSTSEISRKLNVTNGRIRAWEKELGIPASEHPHPAWKTAKYEAQIEEMFVGQGMPGTTIATKLVLPQSTVNAVIKRKGLRGVPKGAGRHSWKLAKYEPRICELVAADKSDWAIAKDIGLPPTSVSSFIKRMKLREETPTNGTDLAQTGK